MFHTVILYAGILGLMNFLIATRPGFMRGSTGISVGDGGNPQLLLAMRRHANFAEWVPLALLLIALLETQGVSATVIHSLGASLVVARAAHAIGIKGDTVQGAGRAIGAFGTALVTIVTSVWLLVEYFT